MKPIESNIKCKVFFVLLFVVAFFISASIMPYVGIKTDKSAFPVTPDLLFALSIVCGIIYENKKTASIMALIFGTLSDVFITNPIHLSPLLFFLGAYFAASAVGVFTKENSVSAAVASIPFFLIRSVCGGVVLVAENPEAKFGYIVKSILLPELAGNVVTVFFVYFIVKFLYKRFKKRFYI